jgi:hypothetical protein
MAQYDLRSILSLHEELYDRALDVQEKGSAARDWAGR